MTNDVGVMKWVSMEESNYLLTSVYPLIAYFAEDQQ